VPVLEEQETRSNHEAGESDTAIPPQRESGRLTSLRQ